jgi:glycosyltransferase involved in cell wall biosynthesis
VDGVIATGRAVAEELAAAGVADARIRIVQPGRELVAPPASGLPELRRGRRMALLCAANWLPRKGLVPLLGAVARLPEGLVTVHLAGDERADRGHRRRVRRLLGHPSLKGRVVVHGTVSPARMAALYAAADVFALPSRDEPYGMVYTEAMASGLPVIGWRSGNLPHLCTDRREGLLVPRGDVAGLAAAIRMLAEDAPLRERLSRAAAQRAAGLPDWNAAAAAFVSAALSLGTHPDSGGRSDPR